MFAVFPSWANRMDDVFRLQMKAGRDNSRTSITVTEFAAGFLQLIVTRRFEDGSANTAASPEAVIGSIDDSDGI